MAACAIVVLGLAISAAVAILDAKRAIDAAHADIDQVTSGTGHLTSTAGRTDTQRLIDQINSRLAAARHDLNISPGVAAMWAVPYLHSQRAEALRLIDTAQTTVDTGQTLLTSLDALVGASGGTTISLAHVEELHSQLAVAESRLAPLTSQPSGILPLLGPLGHAEATLDAQESRLVGLLSDGKALTSYAYTFLGGSGPRSYLLVAQNNAEMRDQGAVESYSVITTAGGTFTVGTAASVTNVSLSSPAPVTIPPGMQAVFGGYNPTQLWQSTNATADFSWSGNDMAAMFQQATGDPVDGVLALDVPGLARLLELTGPVSVPGIPVPVDAQNVSTILLHDLYVGVPLGSTQEARDSTLSQVAKATFDKMKTEHVDTAAFADALAQDVAGRHLLAYDSVPANEAIIRRFGGSGAVDTQSPGRTFHVAVEDGSANKLDYYTRVSTSYEVQVTKSGAAYVTTKITTDNTAPAGQPPSYQFGPDGINASVAGEYVGRVYLWSPRGSTAYGSVSESGLRVSQATEDLLPQQSQTVQFQTIIPDAVQDGRLHLVFVPQPRLVPEDLTVSVEGDGWTIGGPTRVSAPLTKTLSYTWNLAQ